MSSYNGFVALTKDGTGHESHSKKAVASPPLSDCRVLYEYTNDSDWTLYVDGKFLMGGTADVHPSKEAVEQKLTASNITFSIVTEGDIEVILTADTSFMIYFDE